MRTLYTLGYEGTDITRFVQTLLKTGVKVLADVRALPLSRKKGFSKRVLAERLSQEGIRYVHFKQLGDPKPGRDAARAGRHDEFRRIYARHLGAEAAVDALEDLARLADTETTCLMCFERDPSVCHRSMVTDLVCSNGTVLHLYAEPHVQPTRITRRSAREGVTATQQAVR
jgi:uncharacterized protein (DUF488 family)